MGASMWDYIVPFQPRLETALEALRQRVFHEHEYYFVPDDDGAWPATMEQLWSDEDVKFTGTHSVLDVFRVIAPDEADAFGTLRPLRPDEQLRYFGTVTPTRTDVVQAFARRDEDAIVNQGIRWSGYSTPLYSRGVPEELVIWGFSGD
jgi:hypothetical protein